jgi:hypothetical protein
LGHIEAVPNPKGWRFAQRLTLYLLVALLPSLIRQCPIVLCSDLVRASPSILALMAERPDQIEIARIKAIDDYLFIMCGCEPAHRSAAKCPLLASTSRLPRAPPAVNNTVDGPPRSAFSSDSPPEWISPFPSEDYAARRGPSQFAAAGLNVQVISLFWAKIGHVGVKHAHGRNKKTGNARRGSARN